MKTLFRTILAIIFSAGVALAGPEINTAGGVDLSGDHTWTGTQTFESPINYTDGAGGVTGVMTVGAGGDLTYNKDLTLSNGGLNVKSTIISGDSISGLAPLGTNITTNIALNTTDLRGKIYLATAAAIVTLDAAADAGYGALAMFIVQDIAETLNLNPDNAEKFNLHGVALAAGESIDSPGQPGDIICIMSTDDADGSGTDGWRTLGYVGGEWSNGG